MPEAKITVTFTPREFDAVREALDSEYKRALGATSDRHTDVSIRAIERKRSVELNDVLAKLR